MVTTTKKTASQKSLDVLAEKTEQNAEQIAQLVTQVQKITDQISALATAVSVGSTIATNLSERVAKIEQRFDSERQRIITQGFNANLTSIGWFVALIIGILSVVIGHFK